MGIGGYSCPLKSAKISVLASNKVSLIYSSAQKFSSKGTVFKTSSKLVRDDKMETNSGAKRREIFLPAYVLEVSKMNMKENWLSLIFGNLSTDVCTMSLILPEILSTVPYRLSLKKKCVYICIYTFFLGGK